MHKQSVSIAWRKFKNKYRLVGNKCNNCGSLYYPPRNICLNCRRSSKLEDYEFKENGKIYSFSVIHTAARGFEKNTPYVVAIIELEKGVRICGQIVDCKPDKLKIGMDVFNVFRKIYTDGNKGIIKYGLKFKL